MTQVLDPIIVESEALGSVIRERLRQIDLGYDIEHDSEHGVNDLVNAAMGYLHFPWNMRENLVKAAAVIVAAIDVLDRQELYAGTFEATDPSTRT